MEANYRLAHAEISTGCSSPSEIPYVARYVYEIPP